MCRLASTLSQRMTETGVWRSWSRASLQLVTVETSQARLLVIWRNAAWSSAVGLMNSMVLPVRSCVGAPARLL